MTKLFVGTDDFTQQLVQTEQPFLFVGEGADQFIQAFPNAALFDVQRHSFNPLPLDHKQARDFAEMVYTASPQGQTTLTVRNGRRAFPNLLKAASLADLPTPKEVTDDGEKEALATVADLLGSPVIRSVLTGKPNFYFKGSVVAKLDRSVIGDFDAFILASLLISQFKGQVIVSDAIAYLRDMHVSLIRQDRLIAAVRDLSQLTPKLRNELLFIKDKVASRCLFDDAETLAKYAGLDPNTVGHTEFIARAMA